jgi:transcriptional regulator with XRE-family HTH domain
VPARRGNQSKQATRLARLRIERGMSQGELAEASGISIATFRRLERGSMSNPPIRYLANCAIVLDVELEELIEEEWRGWLSLGQKKPPRDPKRLWQPGRYDGNRP